MSSQHILLAYATRKPYRESVQMPVGSFYDDASGLWRNEDGIALIDDPVFAKQKGTKKCDQETGEDQKGE